MFAEFLLAALDLFLQECDFLLKPLTHVVDALLEVVVHQLMPRHLDLAIGAHLLGIRGDGGTGNSRQSP